MAVWSFVKVWWHGFVGEASGAVGGVRAGMLTLFFFFLRLDICVRTPATGRHQCRQVGCCGGFCTRLVGSGG